MWTLLNINFLCSRLLFSFLSVNGVDNSSFKEGNNRSKQKSQEKLE